MSLHEPQRGSAAPPKTLDCRTHLPSLAKPARSGHSEGTKVRPSWPKGERRVRLFGTTKVVPLPFMSSPDTALVLADHFLAGFATEGLREFGHILKDVVYSITIERVSLCENCSASGFRPQ